MHGSRVLNEQRRNLFATDSIVSLRNNGCFALRSYSSDCEGYHRCLLHWWGLHFIPFISFFLSLFLSSLYVVSTFHPPCLFTTVSKCHLHACVQRAVRVTEKGQFITAILYCVQKETHIFSVAISNEMLD